MQEESVEGLSKLFIPDVNGSQGFYSCKAVNDFGSEISNTAELTVKGLLRVHFVRLLCLSVCSVPSDFVRLLCSKTFISKMK